MLAECVVTAWYTVNIFMSEKVLSLESKGAIAMSAAQKATQAQALAFRSGDPAEMLLCLRMEQNAERLGLRTDLR